MQSTGKKVSAPTVTPRLFLTAFATHDEMAVRTPTRFADAPRVASEELDLCRFFNVNHFGDDFVRSDDGAFPARVEADAPRGQGEARQEAVEFGLAGLVQDDFARLACRSEILGLFPSFKLISMRSRNDAAVGGQPTEAAIEVTASWW